MNKTAIRRAALALALTGFFGAEAHAASRSLAGSYLAARAASQRNDLAAAADYWTQTLALSPGDDRLREQALNFKVMVGDLRMAATLAGALVQRAPDHRLANLTLVVDAFDKSDWAEAVRRIETTSGDAFPPLLASMLSGWGHAGLGEGEAAEAAFLTVSGEGVPMYDLFGGYHWGLAQLAMGEPEAAAATFAATTDALGGAGPRMIRAQGAALALAGRTEEALALWKAALVEGRGDALMEEALAKLEAGEGVVSPVRDARDGAAEAMFSIAGALVQDNGGPAALLYAQLALALRGDLQEARLLVGELLTEQGQYEQAAKVLSGVPRSSPYHASAEVSRAEALRNLGQEDEAIIALQSLTETSPEDASAFLALGDLLRREERFAEAAKAYSAAIALTPEGAEAHWALYYQRGISYERSGAWDSAEADFLKALELEPEQPLALNYLGYSWVEQHRNLDEALSMIERAVAQRPEDGYITDSLGWVLYRMDRPEEAVPHLERAVELAPVDPVINDHLGDALWSVGRKREAEFQWRRALSFDPTEADAAKIRTKLVSGLEAVQDAPAKDDATRAAEAEAARKPNGG